MSYVTPSVPKLGNPIRTCLFSAVLAGLSVAPGAMAAEIVVNGGFEEPVVDVLALGKRWTTFYGQNATATTCQENLEEECNNGTLIPGWNVVWFNADTGENGGPGRIELQRDVPPLPPVGLIAAYEGSQKAELDSHHRYQPPGEPEVSNNVAIFQTLPTCPLTPYTLEFAWKARTLVEGDNTLLVAVDDVVLQTLGQFNPGWQVETYKFISSPDPSQLLGFTSSGSPTTFGAFIDGISVQGPDGSDPLLCERSAVCGEIPAALELLYDGDLNEMDFHDQDPGSVVIETFGPLPAVAQIKVFDHKKSSTELFSGVRRIGETFMVTGELTSTRKWLPPKVIIEISDATTLELVQTVEFHTSCSQPLMVGDQFGGVAVFDFSRDYSDWADNGKPGKP